MQVGVDSVFFPFDYPKRAVLVVFGPVDENVSNLDCSRSLFYFVPLRFNLVKIEY